MKYYFKNHFLIVFTNKFFNYICLYLLFKNISNFVIVLLVNNGL